MQETLDRIFRFVDDCWRYRWWGLLTAWVFAIVGWVIVAVIPNRYEAKAEVYVDTESVLQPVLHGIAVDSIDIGEKLGLVATELLSPPVLEKVILELGLDTQVTTAEQHTRLVQSLEERISLEATRIDRSSRSEAPNLYVLRVRDDDAEQAYAITDVLLNIFMENAIGSTRQDAGEATEFLRAQVQEYRSRLEAITQAITRFKQDNFGRLPEQGETAYERLQAAQAELEETNRKLREEESARRSLKEALGAFNPVERTTAPDGTVVLSPLEERIQAMERRIDELSLLYTDMYPEVIRLRKSLAHLKEQLDQQRADEDVSKWSGDPVYQDLRMKLNAANASIAALQARRDDFEKKVRDLNDQMETLPQIEADLNALNQDYAVTKRKYDELQEQLAAAEMRDEADRTGQNLQFRIIEPPVIPTIPIFPDRLLLSAGASMLALGLGLGLAFALAQLRPVFSSVMQLQKMFPYPVMGAIAHAAPDGRASSGQSNGLFYVGAAMLIVAYAVVAAMFLSGAV